MKVKKLLKRLIKDNYVSIISNDKEIFVGTAAELTDKCILNHKIKHFYTDEITHGTHCSSLVIRIK